MLVHPPTQNDHRLSQHTLSWGRDTRRVLTLSRGVPISSGGPRAFPVEIRAFRDSAGSYFGTFRIPSDFSRYTPAGPGSFTISSRDLHFSKIPRTVRLAPSGEINFFFRGYSRRLRYSKALSLRRDAKNTFRDGTRFCFPAVSFETGAPYAVVHLTGRTRAQMQSTYHNNKKRITVGSLLGVLVALICGAASGGSQAAPHQAARGREHREICFEHRSPIARCTLVLLRGWGGWAGWGGGLCMPRFTFAEAVELSLTVQGLGRGYPRSTMALLERGGGSGTSGRWLTIT